MSFGEIKKAVNSNLGKPLDTLIEEKTGAVNATGGTASAGGIFAKLNKLLTDWTTARAGKIDTIATNVGTLVNGRVVKSVQGGMVTPATMPYTITHAAVDTGKSLVFITGDAGNTYTQPNYVTSRSSTAINITNVRTDKYTFSWQLIEFY